MKGYRIVLLIGVLVALIFFYLGLNEWINSNKASINPPPIVYKERTEKEIRREIANSIRERGKPSEEEKVKKTKNEERKVKSVKTEKNKKTLNKKIIKYKIIQIGAFSKEKNAKVAMKKASAMGYKVTMVKEDGFYKVRVYVNEDKYKDEFKKLKSMFGGAIVIR